MRKDRRFFLIPYLKKVSYCQHIISIKNLCHLQIKPITIFLQLWMLLVNYLGFTQSTLHLLITLLKYESDSKLCSGFHLESFQIKQLLLRLQNSKISVNMRILNILQQPLSVPRGNGHIERLYATITPLLSNLTI